MVRKATHVTKLPFLLVVGKRMLLEPARTRSLEEGEGLEEVKACRITGGSVLVGRTFTGHRAIEEILPMGGDRFAFYLMVLSAVWSRVAVL